MKPSAAKQIKLGVVPIGTAPALSAKVIAAHIESFFNLEADVLPVLPTPDHALDAGRMQYDAGKIMRCLEEMNFDEYAKIVGVLNVDLFIPIFTYVLGQARQAGRCALISIFRLGYKKPSSQVELAHMLERCAKVALHEIGHLFNLVHCNDPLCLMHLSADARELDQSPLRLCRYCRLFLGHSLLP